MSDYPMLISNKLHSFRNFWKQKYIKPLKDRQKSGGFYIFFKNITGKQSVPEQ